jgi:hypothetical protein
MKTLIAALALTTLIASPTFAQSWDPDVGTGNIVAAPYGQTPDGGNIFQKDGTYTNDAHVSRKTGKTVYAPSRLERQGLGY